MSKQQNEVTLSNSHHLSGIRCLVPRTPYLVTLTHMSNQFNHRKIILTEDGSHSVLLPNHQVSYHSKHGAIQESMHVFINSGLKPMLKEKKFIRVFEMGFGTALNAL